MENQDLYSPLYEHRDDYVDVIAPRNPRPWSARRSAISDKRRRALSCPRISGVVGVPRLELGTSTSRTWRATNCATPRR